MPADPLGFDQLLERARSLDRDGDPQEAVDWYRSALEERSDHVATRIALGRALLASQQPAAARTELFVALQHDPDQMVARRLLVDANLALGDDLEAHRWLVEYLRVVPEDAQARALLHEIEPRLRTARPAATRTLGELYLRQGHPREAARVFAALAEDRPEDAEIRALVAEAFRVRRRQQRTAQRLLARLRGWHRVLRRMAV